MRYKVCSIRDRAADVYSQPMFFNSIGGAVRAFGDEVKRVADNNNLHKHPEDFDLYLVAEFDDESGEFIPQVPKMVAVGKDYV
ncbi:MAG: nonstructural protein [Microviridae sp.]|nr:MAG: nonstructural protein [Microviridae sp.]